MSGVTDPATLDEICVVAIAETFRGDGEILCNPIGTTPIIGGRLARATFEPDMVMTDTVAFLVANTLPVGDPDAERLIEAWMPYRDIFDLLWSGRRHVVMGASQIDASGNQNLAAIGDWRKPKAQLLGLRGAPGNLVNHVTSYWVPNHSPRTFVPTVDVVSGPGYDRVAGLSATVRANHEVRRVVSNLACSTSPTTSDACRSSRSTPASPSTRWWRPPGSSWWWATRSTRPGCRPIPSSG